MPWCFDVIHVGLKNVLSFGRVEVEFKAKGGKKCRLSDVETECWCAFRLEVTQSFRWVLTMTDKSNLIFNHQS